jgi:mono/diheme cytochrome c family protein
MIRGLIVKTGLKWLGRILIVLVALIGGAVIYVSKALPKVAPADPSLKIELSKERVARGDYLVHHVNDCFSCHSSRDWSKFGGPVIAGTEFMGGEKVFDERIGLPGTVLPKNISPYNLKNWTDGELVRVLRTGVRKDGEPLFPLMPYQNFAQMTQEDLYSVIAYLRTLKEVPNDVPEHELAFPMNLIVRTIPAEAGPYPAAPDPKDSVAMGAYLVKQASCAACHTPVDAHHQPIAGMDFAGGQEFPLLDIDGDMQPLPGGAMRTANLTPDKETGIGSWSKEAFLERFRDWRGKAGEAQMVKIKSGDFQTVMPWPYYAGMSDADLGHIYDYLHSLKPVSHAVVKYTPPTAH